MLRFLTAGESHGKGLVGIIEGLPSNLKVDLNFINEELKRRQLGYGRGERMKIENDKVEIISGIRNGKTLGSPISFLIKNRDWENWKDKFNVFGEESKNDKIVSRPRPGHVDLAGGIKYNHSDLRNVLERASARETAMRVAIGAIAKILLKEFGIEVFSHVTQIGSVMCSDKPLNTEIYNKVNSSPLRMYDSKAEKEAIALIDETKANGDTLGGIFEVIVKNAPIGLGSHVNWDRKIDAKLAYSLMSLQAIKGVEVGLGFESASLTGSQVHDEIYFNDEYYRKTNNAGGIEGGTTNGNDITVRAAMKPIASLTKPLKSVDMYTKEAIEAIKERSDVCAVPAAAVVGENIVSWVIANELLIKFGGDSMKEIKNNYNNYISYVKGR